MATPFRLGSSDNALAISTTSAVEKGGCHRETYIACNMHQPGYATPAYLFNTAPSTIPITA